MDNSLIIDKKRIDVLGVPLDILPKENLEKIIKGMFSNGEFNQIVFLRLKDLMRARRNAEYRSLLKKAALVIPVSLSLARGASFLKKGKPERYMPFEFVIRLLGILEKHKQTAYLLSSKPKELQISENNLRTSFPDLRIVGRFTGFMKGNSKENIILAIKKASPGLLLAGKGVKGKEKWLYLNRNQFNPGIFLWCGECFDIFCGKAKKMSPATWKRGMEFMPRFLKNPLRFFRIFLYFYYLILLLFFRMLKR